MAYEFYVTIEGTKQGKFRGESPRDGHQDKIACISYSYTLKSPRDAATGQASGKRQHQPVTITKEWGASSPQFFQACVSNEVLKSVLFEFIRTNSDGKEDVYQTVTLTNASISEFKQFTSDAGRAQGDVHELDEISFTFQTISIRNTAGKTAAGDDWRLQEN